MLLLDRIFRNPALAKRDFRILSGDAVCYGNGTGGEQVIFGLLVFQVSGSSFWVGIAFALYMAPLMFVGAPAGAIADWLPRRMLLRFIQIAIAVNLATIGLLIGFGLVELWHILTMTFISGCVRTLYQPVRLSYAVDLVGAEHAPSGLALIHMGNRIGQGVGALIAGTVMQRLGADYAYIILALGHLLGFVLLAQLRTAGGVAVHERKSLGETFVDYGREIRGNRTLLGLVFFTAVVNLFGFSFNTALPELATERLGVGAEALGILHAMRAVGGTLAMGAFTVWGAHRRPRVLYALTLYGFSVGLLALGLSPTFGAAIGALLLVAAMASLTDVLSQTMMQLCVPDRLRGRAMGAWMFSVGVTPLGQLELGALAAAFGAGAALMVNATAMIVLAITATVVLPRLFGDKR